MIPSYIQDPLVSGKTETLYFPFGKYFYIDIISYYVFNLENDTVLLDEAEDTPTIYNF